MNTHSPGYDSDTTLQSIAEDVEKRKEELEAVGVTGLGVEIDRDDQLEESLNKTVEGLLSKDIFRTKSGQLFFDVQEAKYAFKEAYGLEKTWFSHDRTQKAFDTYLRQSDEQRNLMRDLSHGYTPPQIDSTESLSQVMEQVLYSASDYESTMLVGGRDVQGPYLFPATIINGVLHDTQIGVFSHSVPRLKEEDSLSDNSIVTLSELSDELRDSSNAPNITRLVSALAVNSNTRPYLTSKHITAMEQLYQKHDNLKTLFDLNDVDSFKKGSIDFLDTYSDALYSQHRDMIYSLSKDLTGNVDRADIKKSLTDRHKQNLFFGEILYGDI